MKEPATALRILETSRQILEQDGPDAITMRRIAQGIGITPMALYRHFPDRAGLLNAIADSGFEELAGRLQSVRKSKDIEKRLAHILEAYLDFSLEKPRLFELMFLTRRPGARQYPADFKSGRSPTANITVEAVEEGIRNGDFRKDDPWEITFEMGALLQGMIMLYLGGRLGSDVDEFRSHCHRAFRRYFRGIRR